MLDGQAILDRLRRGDIQLPPLNIRPLDYERRVRADGRSYDADAILEVGWGELTYTFVAECRGSSTPKTIREAADRIVRLAPAFNASPLVIAPWLSPRHLAELEEREISGIDLCGNGVVIVPDRMLVFRTGQPNKYPESRPIKDVYRGGSSVVARVFLLRASYASVNDVFEEVQSRSGTVALSTVSKVLKQLEEDLLIAREGKTTRLIQADRLMENLAASYRPAVVKNRLVGRTDGKLSEDFARISRNREVRLVQTGTSSATRYATMASEPIKSFYCDRDPREVLRLAGIPAEETERFANFELLHCDEASVYFDRRIEREAPFASPVQTWLELNAGDKRLREVAEQVKRLIVDGLGQTRAKVANDR